MRIADLGRRFGPAMMTTLASQGISALALLSIVLAGPAVSDAYSLAIQIGTSAFSGMVLQVIYFVAIGRPWMRSWAMWTWVTAAFSVVVAVGVIAGTALTTGISARTAVLVMVFGVGGAFLGAAGVIGVRFACVGRPLLMVGATIVPNTALAIAGVAAAIVNLPPHIGAQLPGVAWALASAGTWIWARTRPLPEVVESDAKRAETDRDSGRSQALHTGSLIVGLIAGTIYPTLFVAALTQLPAGTTTVLFLISRIGTSLVGLTVNSVLAVRFNWHTETASTAGAASTISLVAVVAGAAGLAVEWLSAADVVSYSLVGIGWIAALIAAPLVLREMHARRMARASAIKTAFDLALMASVGTWFLVVPSVSGFFGVYVALQAIALLTAGVAFRRPVLTVISAAMLIVGVAQVIFGW